MADFNLAAEVNRVLGEFSQNVDEAVKEATEETAKIAVSKLRSNSPKNTGKYAKSWFVKTTAGNKHYYKAVVANRKYQLTHLLEYGHNIVSHGVVVGHAQAKPHIGEVEKWVQDNIEGYIEGFLESK